VSRLAAKVRCNYYPLPLREAERIRNLVQYPAEPFPLWTPCVGEGIAFAAITRDSSARRYGIELDAYRAEQAAPMLTKIIQGNCLDTHGPVESFSFIYENPPYDWALSANARERLETVLLNHTFRWLIPGGVLFLVIPAERAAECAQVLASHFKCCRIFRLWRSGICPLSPGPHCWRAAHPPPSVSNFAIARSAKVVCASPRSDANTNVYRSCPSSAKIHTPCRRPARSH